MANQIPKTIVEQFYQAFQIRDGDKMAELYADNAVFSDPVFPKLVGSEAKSMWKMLTRQSRDLQIEYEILKHDQSSAEVQWVAKYTFSKTGRTVVNRVLATLHVEDGKIIEHRDSFNFWRWSKQALGISGWALGWTPLLKRKVQKMAHSSLMKFIQSSRANL